MIIISARFNPRQRNDAAASSSLPQVSKDMGVYQVIFENNKPIDAIKVKRAVFKDTASIEKQGDRFFIKWYLVDSETKKNAIEIAEKVVRRIWGKVLMLED